MMALTEKTIECVHSIGNGPHWTLIAEEREALERTTWQAGVNERRQVDGVMLGDGIALVRYQGVMRCRAYGTDGYSAPYDEKWTAEDTWTRTHGKWLLSRSVALTSSALIRGQPAPHSSIMPVWVGV